MKKYPKEVHDFIVANVKDTRIRKLAEMVNAKFGTDFTYTKMRSYLTNHGLKNGMPKGRLPGEYSGLFPPEIRQFIAENYIGIGPKGMAELLNNTFGTNYTKEQLKSYYGNHKLNSGLTGYFKKGHAPWNKGKKGVVTGGKQTQFKKGHIPHNYVPIGTETVDSDGYIKVKIAEPNAWEYKHRLIWEKHHGRKIPPGHAVIFADGNNRNFNPDNLLLVTRAQLVRMNQRGLIKNDAELTKTGVIIADIYNRMGELKRKHNIK